MLHAKKWMNLKKLCEANFTISFIWNAHIKQIYRDQEHWLVVSWGWAWEWGLTTDEHEEYSKSDRYVLKFDYSDHCTTVNLLTIFELDT